MESGGPVTYLGEEAGSTEESDEVPVAEPLCELETAVGVPPLPAHLHVRCTMFVE